MRKDRNSVRDKPERTASQRGAQTCALREFVDFDGQLDPPGETAAEGEHAVAPVAKAPHVLAVAPGNSIAEPVRDADAHLARVLSDRAAVGLRGRGGCRMGVVGYTNTFIAVAEDCRAATGEIPPERAGGPTVASTQYAMLAAAPGR